MGGHGSHPLGWTVLALVVVAYAHVILELTAAALALAITAWILGGLGRHSLAGRLSRHQDRIGRRRRGVIVTTGSMTEPPGSQRASGRRSADE
jgi:hypothetical protein